MWVYDAQKMLLGSICLHVCYNNVFIKTGKLVGHPLLPEFIVSNNMPTHTWSTYTEE